MDVHVHLITRTCLQKKETTRFKWELVMHFKVDLELCKTWISETLFQESTEYNR